eukprot:1194856-Prorocentrum_minimum.AAC.6
MAPRVRDYNNRVWRVLITYSCFGVSAREQHSFITEAMNKVHHEAVLRIQKHGRSWLVRRWFAKIEAVRQNLKAATARRHRADLLEAVQAMEDLTEKLDHLPEMTLSLRCASPYIPCSVSVPRGNSLNVASRLKGPSVPDSPQAQNYMAETFQPVPIDGWNSARRRPAWRLKHALTRRVI